MAVSVTLYSFAKVRNSTKQPVSGIGTYSCLLKDGTDVWNPTFILTGDPHNCNYCSAFGNYYYVDRIDYLPPHWHLTCTLDSMATWKTQIGAASLYVTRANNTAQRNPNLLDQLPPEVTKTAVYTTPTSIYDTQNGFYVVTVLGNGALHYAMDQSEYETFLTAFNSVGSWDLPSGWTDLELAYVDPVSHIKDIRWYPFALPSGIALPLEDVIVNGWNTHAKGHRLQPRAEIVKTASLTVPSHPQAGTLGSFLNASPYSSHTWVDAVFGTVSVDPNILTNYRTIHETVKTDPACGFCHFRLEASNPGDDSFIIVDRDAEMGVSCLFTAQRVDVQDMINGFASGAAGLMMGNLLPAAMSVVGGALAVQHPKLETTGGIATKAKFTYTQALYSEFVNVHDIDHQTMGYPVCKTLTLGSLSGFVQVAKGDVAVPGPSWAAAEIKSYLEGGFYYE